MHFCSNMKCLFFKFRVTENCRKTFMTYLFVGHIINLFFSLILCISAVFIRISLITKISFLSRHHNLIAVPVALIVTGIATIIDSVIALKFCFECLEIQNKSKNFESFKRSHFCLCVMSCFVLLLTIATMPLFVYELQVTHSSFKKGISEAMNMYRVDSTVKEEIDELQMKYGCCGLESYSDWFKIKWTADKYLNKDQLKKSTNEDKYFLDDVPFSCCDNSLMRACVNERVLDEKAYYGYDYRNNLTLYKKGCLQRLWQFYRKKMFMMIFVIFPILTCFQISLGLSARILQTSVISASMGDKPSFGWIMCLDSADANERGETEENLLK